MRSIAALAAVSCIIPVVGCSTIPDLPDDYNLPIREILLHTTCELRFAFQSLDRVEYSSFGAKNWLLAISLTPKVDREMTASAGLTGKSTSDATQKFFNTWTIGTAPGAQINVKGHRDGSVNYAIRSRQLLDERQYPLNCAPSTPSYHALSQHLGIREWLERTVSAMDRDIAKFARIDKPTFTSQIFIKYNGAGSFTYNFPLGTDFFSLSGNYVLDEVLTIAMTPDPPRLVVQTLPTGGSFGREQPAQVPTAASRDALQRLDQIQLEQTLKNLQIRVQP